MATMLRSAAMTLLSKTLLTFLYKYLSDVDVEGIEMPSLYGSTEGPGSGWGVRLSNVKLREGAELMVLPGGKKPKEKPKSSTNEPADGNSSTDSSISTKEDASIMSGRKKKKRGRRKDDHSANGEAAAAAEHNGSIEQKTQQNGTDTQKTTIDAKRNRKSTNYLNHARSSSGNSTSTEIAEATLLMEDSDAGSLESLQEQLEGSRPETPVQGSSISFLSCFAPDSGQAGKNNKNERAAEQREQEANLSSETSSQEEREDESRQYSKDINGGTMMNGGTEMKTAALTDAIQKGIDEKLPEIPDLLEDETDEEYEFDEEEEEGSQSYEEEEDTPQSPPMALRIGEGGYIGTLDVRLVGKELHVLVEDAFLTVEAVTKEAEPEEPLSPKNSTDTDNATEDPKTGESTEKTAAPAPAATPVDINDLKTTGERVLAKNAIARIFSSIPHLSLRDVVVRLIVRGDNQDSESSTQLEDNDDSDDTELIVDIGIGLLSVTEGDDFVSPFNDEEEDTSTRDDGEEDETPSLPRLTHSSSYAIPSPDNEYLERRIRTGKGEDGGLWVNIVTPRCANNQFLGKKQETVSHAMEHRWAREVWLESTRNCFLRCSGLDIQARIFLGTKHELSQANSSYLFYSSDMSTYEGIDHTLYGFDHVVPGPTPSTLPPLAPGPHCSASRSMEEGDDSGMLRSQVYKADRNGIQSCQMASNFYRVAREMTPTRCTLEHLPCENCIKCWEASGKRTGETVDETHILDSYTPLPGMTLSVSMRDPLELNVDRLSLSGLGLVIGLFKKEVEPDATDDLEAELEAEAAEAPPITEVVTEAEPTPGYFSSFFFGSTKAEEGESRLSGLLSPRRRKAKPPAFPTYMKPENIQVLGVFIGDVRLRVHVMRGDDEQSHSNGLSFCYWDVKGKCLTLDQQKLICENKLCNDMRFDLGILDVHEFKGTEKKVVFSAGVPQPTGENDYVSLASLSSRDTGSRPPWPTTACAMLDIPAPLESMVYETRERHGIQLRMLNVTDQPESYSEKSRTLVNCQFGVLEINLPLRVGGVIGEIKAEAMKSLGTQKEEEESSAGASLAPSEAQKKDTATQYRAQVGGGRIRMNPSLDVRLPLTRFAGNICPESGFSMETLLERVEFSYGQSSKKLVPTANSGNGVSLRRFPGVPEHIRLRILLFLDDSDLEPLEKALGLKQQPNSFLRCNAVNKGFSKLATKRTKKKGADASQTKLSRRQQVMNKLLTLDDDALEHLWASHQRKQRKVLKKASSSKKAG